MKNQNTTMQYVGRNLKQLIINLLGFTVTLGAAFTGFYWIGSNFLSALYEGFVHSTMVAVALSLIAYFFYPTYKITIRGSKDSLEFAIQKCATYRNKLKKKSHDEWEIVTNLLFGDLLIKFEGDQIELQGPKQLIKSVRRKCNI